MAIILGIDVGTQSLKAMLLDTEKGCLFSEGAGYDIVIPEIGYAEENPEDWWRALKEVLAKMRQRNRREFDAIQVIGFSGQMHGVVALDEANKAVAPAIIWVDQRSKRHVEKINNGYSKEELARLLHNQVFTGYGFPSLLWMKEERPELYAKIHKVCAPKDYIRMKLTGTVGTDVSDASSMTGFDLTRRQWQYEFLEKCGLDREIFPQCYESAEIAGEVTSEASRETGLPPGTKVVYGSGDLAALLLGCGICAEGISAANIGTGANYNCYSAEDRYDSQLRMQEFCNAVEGSYALAGAILSGGLSLRWLKKNILDDKINYGGIDALAEQIKPGSEGVIFLPYLGGERAPHMDFNATGMFFGLQHIHDKRHISRAVLEGVIFALKDAESVIEGCGVKNHTVVACGGGARSPLWLQIQADIFEKEVIVTEENEQASLGACIVAGIGAGIFSSASEACASQVRYKEKRYEPDLGNTEIYRHRYDIYRGLYPRLKDLMKANALK